MTILASPLISVNIKDNINIKDRKTHKIFFNMVLCKLLSMDGFLVISDELRQTKYYIYLDRLLLISLIFVIWTDDYYLNISTLRWVVTLEYFVGLFFFNNVTDFLDFL